MSGRIYKRIGRHHEDLDHHSNRIELWISRLRSYLSDQNFEMIFFHWVLFVRSCMRASQPWPWVGKIHNLSGVTYFVWETLILYERHTVRYNRITHSKRAPSGRYRSQFQNVIEPVFCSLSRMTSSVVATPRPQLGSKISAVRIPERFTSHTMKNNSVVWAVHQSTSQTVKISGMCVLLYQPAHV